MELNKQDIQNLLAIIHKSSVTGDSVLLVAALIQKLTNMSEFFDKKPMVK